MLHNEATGTVCAYTRDGSGDVLIGGKRYPTSGDITEKQMLMLVRYGSFREDKKGMYIFLHDHLIPSEYKRVIAIDMSNSDNRALYDRLYGPDVSVPEVPLDDETRAAINRNRILEKISQPSKVEPTVVTALPVTKPGDPGVDYAQSAPQTRSRGWVFTINNHTDDDIDALLDITDHRYLCFGFEIGANGTPHIQGYVYFDNAITRSALSKRLPRAWICAQKGSNKQAIDYVKKAKSKVNPDDWYEFGDMPEQGVVSFEKIVEVMQNPETNFHLYNQYRKSYKDYVSSIPKTHDPVLYTCSKDDLYSIAGYFKKNGMDVSMPLSEYDGEEVDFISFKDPDSTLLKRVHEWIHGFPPKVKNGYERHVYNPHIVVFVCSFKDDVSDIDRVMDMSVEHITFKSLVSTLTIDDVSKKLDL